MRAALYARVSLEEGQDPANQLRDLRNFVRIHHPEGFPNGWTMAGEYVDRASARDLRRRTEWRRLLQDARRRRFDVVLVWKVDRAFRSTLDALKALQVLDRLGVGFVCATQDIDTTTPAGRLLFTVLAAFAEIERDLIAERTRAGMERARREGKHVGRPRGSGDRRRRTRRTPIEIAAERVLVAQEVAV